MTVTKLQQKTELTKEIINCVFQKTIEILYDTTNLPKECDLSYKIEKIEGYCVSVRFSWIRDYVNYDISCHCWDEVVSKTADTEAYLFHKGLVSQVSDKPIDRDQITIRW